MSEFLIHPSVSSAIARPRTYLNMVLDVSSSMLSVRQATILAFNTFLDQQRGDRVDELFVTLTMFADRVRVCYRAVPIAQVPPLTEAQYVPDGSTALYDGVLKTLTAMERSVGLKARVLTVVQTDGYENASEEVDDNDVFRAIIRSYEERGNWTFVLLAAGVNAYAQGASMGFTPGNTRPYTATNVGQALATVGRAVTRYRHGDQLQTAEFFAAPTYPRTQWVQDDASEERS
jgi:hypothetical protein